MWSKYNKLIEKIKEQPDRAKQEEGDLRVNPDSDIEKWTFKGRNRWELYFKRP